MTAKARALAAIVAAGANGIRVDVLQQAAGCCKPTLLNALATMRASGVELWTLHCGPRPAVVFADYQGFKAALEKQQREHRTRAAQREREKAARAKRKRHWPEPVADSVPRLAWDAGAHLQAAWMGRAWG